MSEPPTRAVVVQALARAFRTGMNKTEAAYADALEQLRQVGQIQAWRFEAVTFVLGDDCRYTPDFLLIHCDRTIEFREVKGFWRDDARVKIRIAASLFPWFRFTGVRRERGVWVFEGFGPQPKN